MRNERSTVQTGTCRRPAGNREAMSSLTRDRLTSAFPHWFPKEPIMLQSHVIEIDGVFVGAAARLDAGYRFIATDFRLDELNGTISPSLAEIRRLAHLLFRGGNFAAPFIAAE
jgi:hypothetical protein